MVLGDFDCSGQEASLADCHYKYIDEINCSLPLGSSSYGRRVAGVLCHDDPGTVILKGAVIIS